jgi:hypothetical protein
MLHLYLIVCHELLLQGVVLSRTDWWMALHFYLRVCHELLLKNIIQDRLVEDVTSLPESLP